MTRAGVLCVAVLCVAVAGALKVPNGAQQMPYMNMWNMPQMQMMNPWVWQANQMAMSRVHGARPSAPSVAGDVKPELFNRLTDDIQYAGRKMHDYLSPPYSWMLQAGMDMYGLNHPWVFQYWNAPQTLASMGAAVMEPTEDEKRAMRENGEDPDSSPVKAGFNALGAYATGGDPINAFMASLKEGDPMRTAIGMATGRQSLNPMALMGMLGGGGGGSSGGMDPMKAIMGLMGGPPSSGPSKSSGSLDPLSMLLGAGHSSHEDSNDLAPKSSPKSLFSAFMPAFKHPEPQSLHQQDAAHQPATESAQSKPENKQSENGDAAFEDSPAPAVSTNAAETSQVAATSSVQQAPPPAPAAAGASVTTERSRPPGPPPPAPTGQPAPTPLPPPGPPPAAAPATTEAAKPATTEPATPATPTTAEAAATSVTTERSRPPGPPPPAPTGQPAPTPLPPPGPPPAAAPATTDSATPATTETAPAAAPPPTEAATSAAPATAEAAAVPTAQATETAKVAEQPTTGSPVVEAPKSEDSAKHSESAHNHPDPLMALMKAFMPSQHADQEAQHDKNDQPKADEKEKSKSHSGGDDLLSGLLDGVVGDDPFLKLVAGGVKTALASSNDDKGADPLASMMQALLAPSPSSSKGGSKQPDVFGSLLKGLMAPPSGGKGDKQADPLMALFNGLATMPVPKDSKNAA